MEKSEIQRQCEGCGYKQKIPGDEHISCLFDWGKASLQGIRPPAGNIPGISHGWYNFPFQYDPVWMVEECKGRSEKADPAKKVPDDKFTNLIALLGRR